MRVLLIGLVLFGMVASTEAASFTITTTPEQDAALAALRRQVNTGRETPLTAKQFLDYMTAQWLDSLVSKAGEDDKTTLREAYQSAPQATKDQIKTLLGVQ